MVIDLIDISSILLKECDHFEIAPEHRIVQTGETLVIPGLEPHDFGVVGVLLRLSLDEVVIGFEVKLGHVDIVAVGSHMEEGTVIPIHHVLNIINDSLTE